MDRVDVKRVLSALQEARHISFAGYRRSMLQRRISARMAKLRLWDCDDYLRRLRTDPAECEQLIDTILINVSSFFRNPVVFEVIAQSALTAILEAKRSAQSGEIRVWSAGCAAGEEAFSAAILIDQALGDEAGWTPYVFATDIDSASLRQADSGLFPRESLKDTKLGVLDRYFTAQDQAYAVRPPIRQMVRFSSDDLASPETIAPPDSIFGSFDMVLCRNVLIYFSHKLRELACEKLYRSLAVGGYLVLGAAEALTPAMEPRFRVIDRRNRIYQKLP
jgi:chemotaxis protein methyltransferase CheR